MKEIILELLQMVVELIIEGSLVAWKSLLGGLLGAGLGWCLASVCGSDQPMIFALAGLGIGFFAGFLLDVAAS